MTLSDDYKAQVAQVLELADSEIANHPTNKSIVAAKASVRNFEKFNDPNSTVKTARRLPEPTKTMLSGLNPGKKYLELVLTWVETYWHSKRAYPPANVMAEYFNVPVAEILLLNKSRFYHLALDRRGVARPYSDGEFEHITPIQNGVIALITNLNDRRPLDVKLQSMGVESQQYEGWLKSKTFQATLAARSEQVFENAGVDANLGLVSLIKDNDFRAIKFYFDITGKSTSPEAINLRQTVQVLIEAVQKHVRDPAILQAIAAEVQAIQGMNRLDS